ncbi:hypothetical protein IFM89_019988 [Coptis chinensis]|uniref:Phosphoadenosine phosphosulphate reductase domain-containing protein n=1 Tax=Coptis chinensis TaxID=261450 RepID=A0A835I6H5_9MAGN|nr:hypothetical protein IFM89_019988 [Coptis chinensis]
MVVCRLSVLDRGSVTHCLLLTSVPTSVKLGVVCSSPQFVKEFDRVLFVKRKLILTDFLFCFELVNRFEEVAFSFNGGKDSTVLLHLLRAGYFLQVGKPDDSDGNSILLTCSTSYGLKIETIRLDFKSGLDALLKEKPTKAIFLGTRIGDPNAVVIVHNFILLERRDTYTFLPSLSVQT